MTLKQQLQKTEEEFARLLDAEDMFPMSVENWSIEDWKVFIKKNILPQHKHHLKAQFESLVGEEREDYVDYGELKNARDDGYNEAKQEIHDRIQQLSWGKE